MKKIALYTTALFLILSTSVNADDVEKKAKYNPYKYENNTTFFKLGIWTPKDIPWHYPNVTGLRFTLLRSNDLHIKGIDIGAFNQSVSSSGIQLSLFNKSERLSGIGFGLGNSADTSIGFRFGVANVFKKNRGISLGLFNEATVKATGPQIGVISHAHELNSFQIGVINIADVSNGLQIGLVNHTDIRGKGTFQIGLLNFIGDPKSNYLFPVPFVRW